MPTANIRSYGLTLIVALASVPLLATAQETGNAYRLNRCEIVPRAGHQVSLRIDGIEKLRWHYGDQ